MKEDRSAALSDRNPWKWIAAGILAVASHAVWLFWLETTWAAPRDHAPPTPPRLSLVTWTESNRDHPVAHLLETWSASAISLPATHGFSRPILTEEIPLRPPLQSPPEIAMLLDREMTLRHEGAPAVRLPVWDEMRADTAAMPLRLPRPALVPDRTAAGQPAVPVIQFVEGADSRPTEQLALFPGVEVWGDEFWSAELTLYVDAWGVVQRAVLEEKTASEEVNQSLLRSVHAWRWQPADQSDVVRVRLTYVGVRMSTVQRDEEGL